MGFDWEKPEQIWDKVREEMAEFEDAVGEMDAEHREEEMGDYLEKKAHEAGKSLKEMTLEEMDAIWEEAKNS